MISRQHTQMRDHHHHDLHHDLLHVQYCNQDGKLEIHLFFFLLDQGVRFVGLTSTSSFISVVKEDPIFFLSSTGSGNQSGKALVERRCSGRVRDVDSPEIDSRTGYLIPSSPTL